jgi:hypothetical protein
VYGDILPSDDFAAAVINGAEPDLLKQLASL